MSGVLGLLLGAAGLRTFAVAVTYSNTSININSRRQRFVCTVSGMPAGSKFNFYFQDVATPDVNEGPQQAPSPTTTNPVTIDNFYNPNEPLTERSVRVFVNVYDAGGALIGTARTAASYQLTTSGLGGEL